MTATETVANDLQARLSRAETRVKKCESALESAKLERDELAIAVRVLLKHGHIVVDHISPVQAKIGDLNETQNLVLLSVPANSARAVAPKDVTQQLHALGYPDISADYVRTTLWRLAKRQLLANDNGLYWRTSGDEAENVAAPDARAPRAVNESTGPVGREGGYPPSTPEGSIPSGSTQSLSDEARAMLDYDDDIPF